MWAITPVAMRFASSVRWDMTFRYLSFHGYHTWLAMKPCTCPLDGKVEPCSRNSSTPVSLKMWLLRGIYNCGTEEKPVCDVRHLIAFYYRLGGGLIGRARSPLCVRRYFLASQVLPHEGQIIEIQNEGVVTTALKHFHVNIKKQHKIPLILCIKCACLFTIRLSNMQSRAVSTCIIHCCIKLLFLMYFFPINLFTSKDQKTDIINMPYWKTLNFNIEPVNSAARTLIINFHHIIQINNPNM